MSDRTLIVASFAVLYDKREFIKDGRNAYLFCTLREAINFWHELDYIDGVYNAG